MLQPRHGLARLQVDHFTKYGAPFVIDDEEDEKDEGSAEHHQGDEGMPSQGHDEVKPSLPRPAEDGKDTQRKAHDEQAETATDACADLAHQPAMRMNADPETLERTRRAMFPSRSTRERHVRENASPGALGSRSVAR
jgi:hypothetical protein